MWNAITYFNHVDDTGSKYLRKRNVTFSQLELSITLTLFFVVNFISGLHDSGLAYLGSCESE